MPIKPIFEIVEEAKQDIENLTCEDLENELEGDEKPLLVDIREIQEFVDLGTIPDAVHAPRGMLEFWADPSSPYFRGNFTEDKTNRSILRGRWAFSTCCQSAERNGVQQRRPSGTWIQWLGEIQEANTGN